MASNTEVVTAFRKIVMCLPRAMRVALDDKIALVQNSLGDAVDLTGDRRMKGLRNMVSAKVGARRLGYDEQVALAEREALEVAHATGFSGGRKGKRR